MSALDTVKGAVENVGGSAGESVVAAGEVGTALVARGWVMWVVWILGITGAPISLAFPATAALLTVYLYGL